jgi:hypothetical protein
LINRGCAHAEPSLHGAHVDTATSANKLTAFGKAFQGLIHACATAKVQKTFRGQGSPLRELLGMCHDLFA